MNPTVIRHRYMMRMAVAVFWRVFLGLIKLPVKPNWSKCNRPEFLLLGYDKVEAIPETKLLRRKYSHGDYWQKQRVFKFYSAQAILVEILLVGIETVPPTGNNFREVYWAPAAARYRPVQVKNFRNVQEARAFNDELSSQGMAITGRFYGLNQVTYFGDWAYVDKKRLTPFWPNQEGLSEGLELPTPVWPD